MQGGQDKVNKKVLFQRDDTHWFEKITSLLEQNIRGVQLGIYTVAFCGLGIALRSVRPFKKFHTPNQIPNAFFESNIKLHGKVLSIDIAPKPLLLVDHYPILGSRLRSTGSPLPVEIEGINISYYGISWLQTIVRGENIEFTLLKRNESSVNCIVTMKKRNIAKHLVSLGFASVAPFDLDLKDLPFFSKYYAELLKTEEKAEKKRTGIWTSEYPYNPFNLNSIPSKILFFLKNFLKKLQLETTHKVPKLLQ